MACLHFRRFDSQPRQSWVLAPQIQQTRFGSSAPSEARHQPRIVPSRLIKSYTALFNHEDPATCCRLGILDQRGMCSDCRPQCGIWTCINEGLHTGDDQQHSMLVWKELKNYPQLYNTAAELDVVVSIDDDEKVDEEIPLSAPACSP